MLPFCINYVASAALYDMKIKAMCTAQLDQINMSYYSFFTCHLQAIYNSWRYVHNIYIISVIMHVPVYIIEECHCDCVLPSSEMEL